MDKKVLQRLIYVKFLPKVIIPLTPKRMTMAGNGLKSKSFIVALDQGTSSSKASIYDERGNCIASHSINLVKHLPHPGWVEHDPFEILESCYTCMLEAARIATKKGYVVNSETIKALGIANQRETTIIWDSITGKPLYNAIVWLDIRTQNIITRFAAELPNGINEFRELTGLPLNPYFSAPKIVWLMENVVKVREAIADRRARFGTVDSWLLWNLTDEGEGGIHVTDVTNASRTLLFNLRTLRWEQAICDRLGIPMHILPTVKSSAEVYGVIKKPLDMFQNVPIASCLGDQQASLLGHRCMSFGSTKCTLGTGCFILCNTRNKLVEAQTPLITTIACQFGPQQPVDYALEGIIPTAGAGIDWLINTLGFAKDADEFDELASTVEDTNGVYFIPELTGLLDSSQNLISNGSIVGLTSCTTKAHIARAIVEAIGFQTKDILLAIEKYTNSEIQVLKIDGGISRSGVIAKILSDVLGIELEKPNVSEITSYGAAFAAGMAVGVYSQLSAEFRNEKIYVRPSTKESTRRSKLEQWINIKKKVYSSNTSCL